LVADLIGLWLALGLALVLGGDRADPVEDLVWLIPTMPIWAFVFWSYDLYRRPVQRLEPTHLDDIPSLFHALLIGGLALWVYYRFVAPAPQLELAEMAVFGVVSLPLIAVLRAALRGVNRRLQGPERVVAVAPAEDIKLLQRKLENHPEYEMKLIGAVTDEEGAKGFELALKGGLDQVEELIATGQVEHLVVRLDGEFLSQSRVRELMCVCHREGVRFGCIPGVKALFSGVEINQIEGMGILTSNPPVFAPTARRVKRILDVVVSGLLLFLLAPVLALVGAAILFDSGGPILYRQTRVGKHGRRFTVLKFRTMEPGSEEQVERLMESSRDPDWLILENDPRVTRVGRFLRRTSIDELPQLLNVLRGEMSLVGPRPLPEREDDAVQDWHRHRLDLIPGLTGSWQVLGRNNIPFQEMLEIDYAYVSSWSLWTDLRILLRTVPAVISRRGAI
jgi:exopolysaccharide biosynthesis polyprenyl glycosylphosphotransferase